MSLRAHRIGPESDADFLAERRTDPATLRPFEPGDLVVVCAACRTPMLAETWVAFGGAHCSQSETAERLPGAAMREFSALLEPAPGAREAVEPDVEASVQVVSARRRAWPLVPGAVALAVVLGAATLFLLQRGRPEWPAQPVASASAQTATPADLGGEVVSRESGPGGREALVYRTGDGELRLAVVDGGRVAYRLGRPLSAATRVSGLTFRTVGPADAIVFRAGDGQWTTEYVWEPATDALAYRAREDGTGRERFSDGLVAGDPVADFLGYAPAATAASVPAAPTGPTGYDNVATVNSPGDGFLSLRSDPTVQSGRRLVRMPHGAQVGLLGICDNPDTVDGKEGMWCLAEYGGQQGWAFTAYLIIPPTGP